MFKSTIFTAAIAALTISPAVAGHSAAPLGNVDLVQTKVRDLLRSAEDALAQGDINRSLAYADLVMVNDEIKFCINDTQIDESDRLAARQAIYEAIDSWKQSLGDVEFTEVPRNKATVRINIVRDIREMGREVAGYAVWNRQVVDWGKGRYSTRISGDIKVRVDTPEGKPMSHGAMVHAAAHEVGHILGLWDSPNFGDVMGPLYMNQPVTKPSSREVGALNSARNEATAIAYAASYAKALR